RRRPSSQSTAARSSWRGVSSWRRDETSFLHLLSFRRRPPGFLVGGQSLPREAGLTGQLVGAQQLETYGGVFIGGQSRLQMRDGIRGFPGQEYGVAERGVRGKERGVAPGCCL